MLTRSKLWHEFCKHKKSEIAKAVGLSPQLFSFLFSDKKVKESVSPQMATVAYKALKYLQNKTLNNNATITNLILEVERELADNELLKK